jgi:DNA-binding transcriptional LysR family regulator
MHQVRYFLAVSRTLNFTRAAEECHVAQPSLTRAIKQLEEELGGDLFRRERNFTHLTEFGQRMLPFLQQCYDSAASAKQLATSLKSGAVQPLSIALSLAVSVTLIIGFLTELTRAFKGLELRFLRGTPQEIGEFLKKGEAEIAIAGPLGEEWGRLDAWPLFTERMLFAVNREHPLARAGEVAPEALAKERMIRRTYCEHASEYEAALRACNALPAPGHSTCSEEDYFALITANMGIGLLPESTSRSPLITVLSLMGIDFSRTIYCYGVAGRQRSTAATTLLKMLRAADWTELLAPPKEPAPKAKPSTARA